MPKFGVVFHLRIFYVQPMCGCLTPLIWNYILKYKLCYISWFSDVSARMADVCWECGVCKAVFRSRDAWSSHSCNHSSSRPGTALLQHGVVITPGPAIPGTLTTSLAFQCDLCHKVLRDEHTLKCHAKTVHGEKKFSCNTCGKKFPHKGRWIHFT